MSEWQLLGPSAGLAGEAAGTVRLRVSRAAAVDLERALQALDDISWLGPMSEITDRAGFRRVATDLDFPILDGSGRGPVRKAAFVDLGPARRVGDIVRLEIAWRSSSFAPLFPVFAGRLEIGSRELVLHGRYAPPFGRVGLLIDQALLQLVARRTAQALLARMAGRFRG